MMDDLNLSMFRAYDIRTPAMRLTEELAWRLCSAEAIYFKEILGATGVLVAHDARLGGPKYLEIGEAAYREAGLNVAVVPGVCSTSQFYFAAMKRPDCAAVMFGASHNPATDTGQKIVGPGVTPIAEHVGPDGGLDAIRSLYEAGARTQTASKGRLEFLDPIADFTAYSMELAGVSPRSLAGTRIFHDYLNGAAGREMTLAFQMAGAELIPLHYAANGAFPLGDPNPVKERVIHEGLKTLADSNALFGCFFDGDGDRLDVYGGNGRYLASSFVYAALLPSIRSRFGPTVTGVYADLKCNPLAIVKMAASGFSVRIMRNGHSQIKNAIRSHPDVAGAVEESAHYYERFQLDGNSYATENTLYIALLLARIWKDEPERFESLFRLQETSVREREWGYKFPNNESLLSALQATRDWFQRDGAIAIESTPDSGDLEATLLRRGIPIEVNATSVLEPNWLQVCQRSSQSEDCLARWEVSAERQTDASEAKREIGRIVKRHGAGEEYQG